MKKTVWIYLSCFCLLFFLFSAVYYFSYRNLELELAEYESRRKAETSEEHTQSSEESSEPESAAAAGGQEELRINDEMLYIAQSYNEADGILTETILPMPLDFLGMTREELVDYLKGNGGGKTLVSFSSARLVVRSRESVDPGNYRFLLILEEGYLKIYYSDRSCNGHGGHLGDVSACYEGLNGLALLVDTGGTGQDNSINVIHSCNGVKCLLQLSVHIGAQCVHCLHMFDGNNCYVTLFLYLYVSHW